MDRKHKPDLTCMCDISMPRPWVAGVHRDQRKIYRRPRPPEPVDDPAEVERRIEVMHQLKLRGMNLRGGDN